MTRTEAAHVKCCVTCRHWHNNGKLASSYGDCAKGHPCNQGTCSHYCKDHEYANISDLPRYALPYLPPALAATRRARRSAAVSVPSGPVPADCPIAAARRTGKTVACAECGAKATQKCHGCGISLCDRHIFLKHLDGNNASITKYSPWVCRECHPDTFRPHGVMDSPATEPNRKDATPATGL